MTYYLNVLNNEIISYSELPVLECLNLEVTKSIYDDYIKNPSKYYVVGNELKIKSVEEQEAEKELKEKERVAKLSMTKYDFFKYVCKPYGITYPTLLQFVNSNDDIAAAWDLCARVYRGDELLCANITRFVPAVTADVLDVIFKEYGE